MGRRSDNDKVLIVFLGRHIDNDKTLDGLERDANVLCYDSRDWYMIVLLWSFLNIVFQESTEFEFVRLSR